MDTKYLKVANKFIKHLISLGIAAIFLILACIFMYVFTGVFTQAKEVYRVGVIDTGLDLEDPRFKDVLCESGHRDFTGEGMRDNDGHGTHVAGIIKKFAGKSKDYCLTIFKFYSKHYDDALNAHHFRLALQEALALKLPLINYSGGGSASNTWEKDALAHAQGITVLVAAAGNGSQNLVDYPFYPASYGLGNIIVVGALKENGKDKFERSNFGPQMTWEVGENVISTLPEGKEGSLSGTSMATAIHTGKLIAARPNCGVYICK